MEQSGDHIDSPEKVINQFSGTADSVIMAGRVDHLHLPPVRPRPTPRSAPITDQDPFALQIHRVADLPGGDTSLSPLTAYFRRAHDDELDRALSDVAGSHMVVLVGGSSTGKTRTLYEAITRHDGLRSWPLLRPGTGVELHEFVASGHVRPRSVLWLNDAHVYLAGPSGPAAASALSTLLNDAGAGPVIVVATLWPEFWDQLTAAPKSIGDEHAQARQLLLHQAGYIRVAQRLTEEQLAALLHDDVTDARLAAAARASGEQRTVFQTLVGGPLLVDRYSQPLTDVDRYAKAVISVAVDARRMGHQQPIPLAALEAAASANLDEEDRVEPPLDWFAQGLSRAAYEKLRGVTALIPRRLSDHRPGPADSFDIHDYLEQHTRISRQREATTRELWDALLAHTCTTDDQVSLATTASMRLMYQYAHPLYERAVESGHDEAHKLLAASRAQQGFLDDLRELADSGDSASEAHLVKRLVETGRLDELRARADNGSYTAQWELSRHLAKLGLLVELGQRAGRGDTSCKTLLTIMRTKRAMLAEIKVRAEAEAEDEDVRWALANVLAKVDQLDELPAPVVDDVEAPAGPARAVDMNLFFDEMVQRANAGDKSAPWVVANVLAKFLRVGELAEYADAGLDAARWTLIKLYSELGDFWTLQELADAGDDDAQWALMPLLAARDGLSRVGDLVGMNPGDRFMITDPLRPRWRLSDLRDRAATDGEQAHWNLVAVLAELGRLDELSALSENGDPTALEALVKVFADNGDVERLTDLADRAEHLENLTIHRTLAAVLAEHGDLDALRQRTARGDMWSAEAMSRLDRGGIWPDGQPATPPRGRKARTDRSGAALEGDSSDGTMA